jgi:2-polyprenyl-6-methoxyphenol hydroxylase-like FAD-dependent oxidoreductase
MNAAHEKKTIETDVLIAGAGMAGYAAAMATAETGRKVMVVEQHHGIGGAATQANVGTLCGLYYRGAKPTPVPHPFCTALTQELLQTYPQINILSLPQGLHVIAYEKNALNHFLKAKILQQGIAVIFGAHITDVQTNNQELASVTYQKDGHSTTIRARAFVDCTGTGILAQQVSHPMLRNDTYQAAAQVIRFENVGVTTEFALNLSLRKVMIETQAHQHWPQSYLKLSVVPGSLRGNRFDLKWPLAAKITDDATLHQRLQTEVTQNLPQLLNTLRNVESLAHATVLEIAPMPGVRIQQRPEGKYILTHTDVTGCTKPEDGVALGTWPVEEWDYTGQVNMEYLPEGDGYLIPARTLMSPVYQNLFFAGKGISANTKAIASARVTGTCLQTGYAAGRLAASTDGAAQQKVILALHATLTQQP